MDDAAPVGVVERLCALEDELGDFRHRQQAFGLAIRVEGRGAVDELHDQVRCIVLLTRVENPDDVRMVERPGRVGLVEEHLARQPGGVLFHVRPQAADLDGHVPVMEEVVADVDHAHAATAGGADDGIFSDFLR